MFCSLSVSLASFSDGAIQCMKLQNRSAQKFLGNGKTCAGVATAPLSNRAKLLRKSASLFWEAVIG